MPQLFQVLKCYKCSIFQVNQTKKSNKWECKLCGEKQSIKRHYGLGSGKECRLHVQKLNGIRGEIDDQKQSNQLQENSDDELENNTGREETEQIFYQIKNKESKWSNFIDEMDHDQKSSSDENMVLGNLNVVLEVPTKMRRKFKTPKVIQQPTMIKNDNGRPKTIETRQISSLSKNLSICIPTNGNTSSKINSSKITMFDQPGISDKIPQTYKLNKEWCDEEAKKTNIQDDNSIKRYIPPKLNYNTKWGQFIEPDDNENDGLLSRENLGDKSNDKVTSPKLVPIKLFTQCDDTALDDVLKI